MGVILYPIHAEIVSNNCQNLFSIIVSIMN